MKNNKILVLITYPHPLQLLTLLPLASCAHDGKIDTYENKF